MAFTALTGFLADRFSIPVAMLLLAAFFLLSLLAALGAIRLSHCKVLPKNR